MKTRLFLMLLIVTSLAFSQTLPSGHYGKFEFTAGSLENNSVGPDLSGSIVAGTDRFGNATNALNSLNILTGHTLGAGTSYTDSTLSFWIKSNATINGERIIQIYGANATGFRLSIDNVNLYLSAKAISNNGAQGTINKIENIALADNQWHNIVLRTSSAGGGYFIALDVFVDGVFQTNISDVIDPPGNSLATQFLDEGQMIVNPIDTYTGSIDDIYFYKYALTDAEITSIYNYVPTEQGIFYVDKDATGSNDGTSWADAYVDLQSALASVNDDNQIWIAEGTYKPHASSRNTYFVVSNEDLKIYGGFAGTEASINDRIQGANETILSGDLQGNDANVSDYTSNYGNGTRNSDNSYRIVNITSGGENLLLDGLTISDAHTNVNATTVGGAILKNSGIASFTLKNCVIKNNVSRNSAAGIYADFSLSNLSQTETPAVIIDGCQFINNMSRNASGLYVVIRSDTKVNFTVSNSVFRNNIAGDLSTSVTGESGSAMVLRSSGNNTYGTFNLFNNTIVNNEDTGTKAIIDDSYRAPVIISSIGNYTNTNDNATVSNSIFWNNTGLGDVPATGGLTKAITDMNGNPFNSLHVYNSLDPLSFAESSITNAVNTINTDPLFTNVTNNDFTLTAASPAIGVGNNTYVFGAQDILGNQRIFNSTVDMGAYEFGSLPLGVNNFSFLENKVTLYPNPTTSILNIKMANNLKRASIYSVLGTKVLETTSKTIKTSNLRNGVYLIKIEDQDGSITTKRFIKR